MSVAHCLHTFAYALLMVGSVIAGGAVGLALLMISLEWLITKTSELEERYGTWVPVVLVVIVVSVVMATIITALQCAQS